MTTVMTKEQRLAIIKAAADKVAARNQFKNKVRKGTNAVKSTARTIRREKDEKFDAMMDKMDENYNHWTDAEKYAKEYYGDVYSDTTRYDNDWN